MWFEATTWAEMSGDLWILAVAAMTNVACAVIGVYLVLRRISMLGDALAHAVLPGLVLAFLWGGRLSIGWMFLGAWSVAVLTTFLVQTLERRGGVTADAGMGVVFTALFASGVLLLNRFAGAVHLDPDCVLFGLLEFTPLNTISMAGWEVPRAAVTIAPVLAMNVLFVLVFWKELKLTSFDAALAVTLGFSATTMHYLLMAVVATTTVASFEAVGSILVVAMLLVPGATGHLLSDRLERVMLWGVVTALASAAGGFALAVWFDANIAGSMAVVGGMCYLAALVASPHQGLAWQLVGRLGTTLRILREDALALLYRLEELSTARRLAPREVVQALGGGWAPRWVLWRLTHRGLVASVPCGLELTVTGRAQAAGLVRAHRLWEAFLVEHLGLPIDHVHDPATRVEHYLSGSLQAQIAAELSDQRRDPHGREVPGDHPSSVVEREN